MLTTNFHFLNGDDVIEMVDEAVAEIGGELQDDNIPYKDLFTEVYHVLIFCKVFKSSAD